MINNLSDVFREAKTRLWDGIGFNREQETYICHAIEEVTQPLNTGKSARLQIKAKSIVQERLGVHTNGTFNTVYDYLNLSLNIPTEELTKARVQQYRKDWLTSLENEFKPKLKPKKGFSVQHIDGNLNNNDLSNMIYVKTQGQNKFK